jgi:hypothetical protein
MTLNAWQDRLNEHFQSLHGSAERGTRPIFALEHGLDDEELADLAKALQEHIRWTQPANGHWLAWTVFAAEVGYKFAGDQYWQTFKEQLPGWDQHEDRYYVRDAFRRFHRNFGGAMPSGAWANNFTIISWPIANAVLPKDLQRHLASVLFETRHLFTKSLIEDPRSLGVVIEAHSLWTSSRFRQFAEEHDLVGRIAAALLSPAESTAESLLSLPTLRRITADMQREQRSKDQLNDARRQASSVTFRGIRSNNPGGAPSRTFNVPDLADESDSPFNLDRPEYQIKIVLAQTGDSQWSLKAILPDFKALLQARPQFTQVFTKQRSFVDGADRPFFAAKVLLCGRRPVTLVSLPTGQQPFLRFEEQTPELTALIEAVCHFPSFTSMLFRLTDDGSAVRVHSQTLKPGCRYILLRTNDAPTTIGLQGARPISISCAGLQAVQIDVPDFVSGFFQEQAARLGLEITNGLSVSPAGYPASNWDGEGSVEWTEGSPMLLSVTSDFEIGELSFLIFGLGVDHSTQVTSPDGRGTILDLEHLLVGDYQVHIAARLPDGREIRSGQVLVRVSPVSESRATVLSEPAFAILASPPAPTMEELWNGLASIDIYGSSGLSLDCRLRFYADAEKQHRLLEHPAPRLAVPLMAEDWSTYLNQLKQNTKVSNAYDAAALCSILFRSPGLGSVELDCEREFIPFRLKVKHSSSAYKLRLIQNDTTDTVSLHRASFASPGKLVRVLDAVSGELNADPAGGLYAARRSDITSAIVIPPIRLTSLADIQFVATRLPVVTDAQQLSDLASSIRLWTEAQLIGDYLSSQRRDAALLSLNTCFIESMCGAPWVALEENVLQGRETLGTLAARLGNNQYNSLARSALSGSKEFLELSYEQVIGQALQIFHQSSSSEPSPNDSQCLSVLLAYLRVSALQIEPLPHLPVECSEFALSHIWLVRLLRFAAFAKDHLLRPRPETQFMETR